MKPNERLEILRAAYAGRRVVRSGYFAELRAWLCAPASAEHYAVAIVLLLTLAVL